LPTVPCSSQQQPGQNAPELGFNSSCQQCLAEREEARGGFQGETSFCPETEVQQYKGREYSPEREERGQLSMATSILSTKALVENCDELEPRGGRVTDPQPGRTYECEDICRKGAMLGFSTMGITFIMGGYLMLGAVIFSGLEGGGVGQMPSLQAAHGRSSPTVMNSTTLLRTLPSEVNEYLDRLREHTVNKLWEMTEKMNILYPANWTRGAAEEMLSFQAQLSRRLAAEMMVRQQAMPASTLPYSQHEPRDWDIPRGLLYSLTLITTIGSGCEGVESGLGRLASLCYLVVGLPLMVLYLKRLGSILANAVRCFCCNFPQSRNTLGRGKDKLMMTSQQGQQHGRRSSSDPDWSVVVGSPRPQPKERPAVAGPCLICVFLLLSYISCSAVLVARIQSWSFFDAFYFCFMTLFTVGLGGLSPNQASLTICVLYIFIGLILVSTCWHIFHEEVLQKLQELDSAKRDRKARGRGGGAEWMEENKTGPTHS